MTHIICVILYATTGTKPTLEDYIASLLQVSLFVYQTSLSDPYSYVLFQALTLPFHSFLPLFDVFVLLFAHYPNHLMKFENLDILARHGQDDFEFCDE